MLWLKNKNSQLLVEVVEHPSLFWLHFRPSDLLKNITELLMPLHPFLQKLNENCWNYGLHFLGAESFMNASLLDEVGLQSNVFDNYKCKPVIV